jgi:hypothetical protein
MRSVHIFQAIQIPNRNISYLQRLGDLWSGRLLQVPRGFEKFFPKRDGSKGAAAGGPKNASGSTQPPKGASSKAGGSGGGGGGGGPNPFKKPGGGGMPNETALMLASVGVLSFATIALTFLDAKNAASK